MKKSTAILLALGVMLVSGVASAMEMPFTATITGQATGFISPGDVMNNGMVYVGTMDGVVPLFVNRCDYGFNWNPDADTCDGTRGGLAYQTTSVSTGATSASDGAANTAILAARADTPAAKYCADLAPPNVNSHGYSDWYLPSTTELAFVFTHYVAIGNFITATYYWTSTEYTSNYGYMTRIGTAATYNAKSVGYYVRCLRKGN